MNGNRRPSKSGTRASRSPISRYSAHSPIARAWRLVRTPFTTLVFPSRWYERSVSEPVDTPIALEIAAKSPGFARTAARGLVRLFNDAPAWSAAIAGAHICDTLLRIAPWLFGAYLITQLSTVPEPVRITLSVLGICGVVLGRFALDGARARVRYGFRRAAMRAVETSMLLGVARRSSSTLGSRGFGEALDDVRCNLDGIARFYDRSVELGVRIAMYTLTSLALAHSHPVLAVMMMGVGAQSVGRRFGGLQSDLEYASRALVIDSVGAPERVPGKRYVRLDRKRTPEIRVDGVHLTVGRGFTPVLRDVSICLEPGKVYGFCGDSGSGKTTLVRLLLGGDEASAGKIRIDGHDIREVDPDDVRAIFGYLSKRYLAVESSSVRRAITFSRRRGEAALSLVGDPSTGTSYRNVALARAILKDARVIVIDEMGADEEGGDQLRLLDALRSWPGGNPPTVILISHDAASLRNADAVFHFRGGTVTAGRESMSPPRSSPGNVQCESDPLCLFVAANDEDYMI